MAAMLDDAIRVFHVQPALARARIRSMYRGVMVAFVLAQGLLVAGTLPTTPAAHRLSFWLPAALVFAVVVLLFTRSIVRVARRVATYQVTMGPNVLRIVHGSGRLAGVPRYLDGYEAARARLAAWHAIERGNATIGRILLVTPAIGLVVGGLPLPATVLIAVNAAWAASLLFFSWRVSRTSFSKKERAGKYVASAVLLVWALWRLGTVWR